MCSHCTATCISVTSSTPTVAEPTVQALRGRVDVGGTRVREQRRGPRLLARGRAGVCGVDVAGEREGQGLARELGALGGGAATARKQCQQ